MTRLLAASSLLIWPAILAALASCARPEVRGPTRDRVTWELVGEPETYDVMVPCPVCLHGAESEACTRCAEVWLAANGMEAGCTLVQPIALPAYSVCTDY